MKYKIKYYYQTGDSFGSEDAKGVLEMTWENLDVAKQNLRRIKEHYAMVQEINSIKWSRIDKTREEIANDHRNNDWFVKDNQSSIWENCIILYADNGNPWQFWCPWCGYFERLHSAKIITKTPVENDMEINF